MPRWQLITTDAPHCGAFSFAHQYGLCCDEGAATRQVTESEGMMWLFKQVQPFFPIVAIRQDGLSSTFHLH